jgi:H+/Cl- antiporter ClcA
VWLVHVKFVDVWIGTAALGQFVTSTVRSECVHLMASCQQAGLATLGSFTAQGDPGYTLLEIPFFLILGGIGGLLGALFVFLHKKISILRDKYRKSIWSKMTEVSGCVRGDLC